jgi:hypothetical protein
MTRNNHQDDFRFMQQVRLEFSKMWREGWQKAGPFVSRFYGAFAAFAIGGYLLGKSKSVTDKDSK